VHKLNDVRNPPALLVRIDEALPFREFRIRGLNTVSWSWLERGQQGSADGEPQMELTLGPAGRGVSDKLGDMAGLVDARTIEPSVERSLNRRSIGVGKMRNRCDAPTWPLLGAFLKLPALPVVIDFPLAWTSFQHDA
jgi:hypothetical protein